MPNSLGSTLIWRRSAARMVSCVMGTSYDLPVRLSVMVSVWRGVLEPSCFLVVVAESGESIEKSWEAAERVLRCRYHCTPKGAPRETGRRGGAKCTNAKGWLKSRGTVEAEIYLLTIVVITSIIPLQDPGGGP